MQFVQRPGATQERTTKMKTRRDLNEIQEHKKTSVTIVEGDLLGTSSSMGHCFFPIFFMGAGIAKRFKRLHSQMKDQAFTTLTPGSVFAYYDLYSRRWISILVTKQKYFHKPFFDSRKNSPILMRNHAEAHCVKNIRLPDLGCGLDKLQSPILHKILHEVFQQTDVSITVCIRNDKVTKRNG